MIGPNPAGFTFLAALAAFVMLVAALAARTVADREARGCTTDAECQAMTGLPIDLTPVAAQ